MDDTHVTSGKEVLGRLGHITENTECSARV